MLSSRRLLGLVLSITLATGMLAAAPPALAATTSPDSVTVDYNGGQYQISTTTLSGAVGATFVFRNRINGQSLYLQNSTGSVTLGGTNCTGNHTCGVAAGADGTYTVTSAGTISVNTDATDGRFTLTITEGAGGSSAQPVRATLTYDANGGTCTTTSSGAQIAGTWINVPDAGTCTRAGWTFLGFSTSPTNAPGSVFLAPGAPTAVTGDNTLYAQWKVRVAADWTSSACPGADVYDIEPGEAVTLPAAKVCGSEILAGWGLSAELATPVTYAPGEVVRPTENLTVWAVWSPVQRVSLTCAVAAGSPVDVIDVGRDLPLTLPLACHDTQVARWTTNADGTGTSYPAGSTMRTTTDQVLYARAEDAPITITWHGNGGTCPSDTTSVAWGSTFEPAACTRFGFAIVDWTTDGTSTGTSLIGMPLRSSVDAYPVWAAIPVLGANWVFRCETVYKPATWNPTSRLFEVTLPKADECDNEPYSVLSWNSAVDGSGTSYQPGQTIPLADSIFVAAQWGVPITYDFNLPDGDTSCPTVTVIEPFGRPFTLPDATSCARSGYLLADWAKVRAWTNGVDPQIAQPGGSLTAFAPTTYYAWWGPPVEITFDPAGGTCSTATMTVGAFGLFTLPPATDCTRPEYRLSGWALTANASKPHFAPGATGIAFFPFSQPRFVAQWVSTSHCNAPAAPGVDWHECDKQWNPLTSAKLGMSNLTDALVDHAVLTRADLSFAQMSGASLTGALLDKALLGGADLSGADLSGANLSGADLGYANLTGANLVGANLTGTNLGNANLTGANLTFAIAPKATFSGANLTDANLFMANLEGADFAGASLPGMDLTTARLKGASFNSANLSKVKLAKTKLVSVSFAGTALDEGDLTSVTGTGINFAGAHGRDVNLDNAKLPDANFNGANLPDLNATGITLTGASIRSATLTGADFTNAKLTKADFTNTNAMDALLNSLNLSGVDFTGANLGRATFTSTTFGTANLTRASIQDADLAGKDFSSASVVSAHFGDSDLTGADFARRDLTDVHFPNADLSNANFYGAYTAKIDKGCLPEGYYRNSQVILRQPMRNLPVVSWRYLADVEQDDGSFVRMFVYTNAQWGMDERGDFLMFCAL